MTGATGPTRATRAARAGALAACLTCLASPVGCKAPSASARMQGHWIGTAAEGVTGEALVTATAFATGTVIDVRGDEMTVTTPKETQAGHYRVVREDATTLVVATDRDGFEHPQTFVFTNRDQTMRWAVVPGQAIVFARQ